MILEDRDQLIEAIGRRATERITDLVERIEKLEEYLDLIPVFKTKGWHYEKAIRPNPEDLELKPIEQ